jgi:hypothetical protein
MAEELFSAGASLLKGAADTSVDQNLKEKQMNQQGAEVAEKQGADSAQLSMQQKAQMALEKLKMADNRVKITPQIALGLVKNTGDKEWLKAVGTDMRSDVLLGLYSHGINQKISRREYKVPVGDKIVTMVPRYNPETADFDFEAIGEGEKFSPTQKGDLTPAKKAEIDAKNKHSGPGTKEAPEDKEFLKTYRQYQKETEGMNYMLLDQMSKKDPKQASDLKTKLDFIQKNTDRFNKLQGVNPNVSQGTSGGDDQKAIDYLKKNYPQLQNPTPQDIQWAKGKIGG